MKTLSGRNAVVVDGHPLWLDGMARLLEGIGVSVVAKSTEPDELIELVRTHAPDVVVVGLGTWASDAELLESSREIRQTQPNVKVVLMAPASDDRAIDAAFAMGVSAYCIKSAEPDDVMAAIRQSFEQSIYLAASRGVATVGPESYETWNEGGDGPVLTKRELEILRLVAEGHSNTQLARMLWVTEQTVKFHLSNIYRKLDVANRTEASRWAQIHGLLAENTTTLEVSVA
jgi:DNA-binding NarL/FixJ family response regulator